MKRALLLLLLAAAAAAGPGIARADPPPSGEHTLRRAGHPDQIGCWAQPSQNPAYVGYLIGGGSPFQCSDYPYPWEGTWGWDYQGWCFPRRVVLRWFHGAYQGGYGAYKTDGPKLECHEE